ncbi:universal stress protein [Nocardiopsis composta]|uniref:Nucleotide-binding universal stress UspA family protein n=1 Tax=Nocardiopsis composta TaxID=157465 RepID=A0A7W8VCR3_9ACTN|nr:universal stress protein [Nocardiopsis composta]MBB5431154.1 nucleotide-binding universal stress UspA family protein [Nocardiopsis composta]
MERPILAGVDGSEEALKAADWAAVEAERRGRRLILLTALAAPGPDTAFAWSEGQIREEARHILDEAEKRATEAAPGLRVGRLSVVGAAAALLNHAEDASMAVVGLRGRGGFPGLKIGSIAYRVAAHASVPVTVVGPEPLPEDRTGIVVGEDGRDPSRGALAEACETAALTGEPVLAVRAWERPLPPAGISPMPYDTGVLREIEQDALERAVAPWRTEFPGVELTAEVVEGRPVPALVEAAQRARLIVVAARGRRGVPLLALGSTAHGLLHRAECPVTVVHGR